jgi:hypothetical protein
MSPLTGPAHATVAGRRTAVGPCRHCRQPLEHSILRDENDQPVDWYLGRGARGVLDGTCSSPDAPARDCDMCAGTGGELGDPDVEWACDSCDGTGRTTDHQPDLATAIERALADYRGSQGDPDSPTRWALDVIGQTTSHAQINAWLAEDTIDAETAAAYHAVLIASHDDLAAALVADQPVVLIAITSGGE